MLTLDVNSNNAHKADMQTLPADTLHAAWLKGRWRCSVSLLPNHFGPDWNTIIQSFAMKFGSHIYVPLNC